MVDPGDGDDPFRRSFERSPLPMIHVGRDCRVVAANDATASLLGNVRGGIEGRAVEELFQPEDGTRMARAVQAMVEGSLPWYRGEDRLVHAAGPVVWASVAAAPIPDEAGTVTHVLIHLVDVTDQRDLERQLRAMVDQDPLTGLRNRRSFEAALSAQVRLADRYGATGAVLMLDLDNLKTVNDTFGHRAGDELLVAVADLLRSTLRSTDVIARLGGDEFAVILPRATPEQAEAVAGKLLDAIRRDASVAASGRSLAVTTSIGIAPVESGGPDAAELLRRADLAMYDAKEGGRDRAVRYRAGGEASGTERRLAWIDRVEKALAGDGFVLFAQPIVDLATGVRAWHEVLVRMRSGTGLAEPAAFLAAAERAGIVDRIDRWVLGAAADLLETAGLPPGVRFSVNVSGASLASEDLVGALVARLKASPATADRLSFELTETDVAADLPRARAFAERLAPLGCRFTLADFGTGFGTFAHLEALPVDAVKMSASLVRRSSEATLDRLVVDALVRVAHGLGKKVVAQRVEDGASADLLRLRGVDFAQGYQFGRPFPASDLVAPPNG